MALSIKRAYRLVLRETMKASHRSAPCYRRPARRRMPLTPYPGAQVAGLRLIERGKSGSKLPIDTEPCPASLTPARSAVPKDLERAIVASEYMTIGVRAKSFHRLPETIWTRNAQFVEAPRLDCEDIAPRLFCGMVDYRRNGKADHGALWRQI